VLSREDKKRGELSPAWLILPVAILAIFVFHLSTIGLEDYWADEMFSYRVASLGGLKEIRADLEKDIHPPLYYLSLHYFLKIAGPLDINFRWLSALWGMVGLSAMYFLAGRGFSKRASIFVVILLAANPFWLFFSRELRTYTLLCSLLWGSAALLIPATRSRGKGLWFLSGVLAGLAIWAHYLAVFFILAEILAVFIHTLKKGEKSLAGGFRLFLLTTAMMAAPLAGLVLIQILHSMAKHSWMPHPLWHWLLSCFPEDYLIHAAAYHLKKGFILRYVSGSLFGIFLLISIILWRKDSKSTVRSFPSWSEFPIILVLSCSFVPVTIMFFLSFTRVKFYLPFKYTIICLGPFLCFLAVLMSGLPKRWIRITVLSLFLGLEIIANFAILRHDEKPDWQGIAAAVDRHVGENDVLLISSNYYGNAYSFYSEKKHPPVSFDDLILQSKRKPGTIYHLMSCCADVENPYFPSLTIEFMKRKWGHTELFREKWYTFLRHENVDFDHLRRWYLGRRSWKREEILRERPIIFLPVEDLDVSQGSHYASPLELRSEGQVMCWLHDPPVTLPSREKLPPGRYTLKLKIEPSTTMKNPHLSVRHGGRVVKEWVLSETGPRILEATWEKLDAEGNGNFILDGDSYRPSEVYPDSGDTRRLFIKFYWLAVVADEGREE